MTESLVCWHCGASIEELPLLLSRRAECPACNADLHVCLMCAFYDERAAQSCSEPVADEVKAKDKANFCGYFQPRAGAYAPGNDEAAARARAELEALFGLAPPPAQEGDESEEVRRAREELERLFPPPGDDTKGS